MPCLEARPQHGQTAHPAQVQDVRYGTGKMTGMTQSNCSAVRIVCYGIPVGIVAQGAEP